jgi:hypothetical protein
MRASRSLAAIALTVLAASAVALAVRPQPSADAISRAYRVKECFDSYAWGRIPLRIGNGRFGYTHIKQRRGYNARTRALIARTLLSYAT